MFVYNFLVFLSTSEGDVYCGECILTFVCPLSSSALLRHVSITAREHEDMMNIITSSYIDSGSAGCFTYFKPQVVYNEQLEKEVRHGEGLCSFSGFRCFASKVLSSYVKS